MPKNMRAGIEFSKEELSQTKGRSAFIKEGHNFKINVDLKDANEIDYLEKRDIKDSASIHSTLHAGFNLTEQDNINLRDLTSQEACGESSTLESTLSNKNLTDLKSESSLGALFWVVLAILTLGGLEAYSFIAALWEQSIVLGIVSSLLIGSLIFYLLLVLWGDLRAVMFFKITERNRMQYENIVAKGKGSDAFALCLNMAKVANLEKSFEWQQFSEQVQEHYDAKSVFMLYERFVLKAQDEAVKRIIVKASADTAVVVALSPLAWFDMLVSLFRTVRMIRQISEIYGMRLGFGGRMRLYKRVLKNLIFIGASELLTDVATDWLGASMAARISTSLGQGAAAAIYSCRLGYLTARETRPIAPSKDILSISLLRRELLANTSFKSLFSAKTKKEQ